MHNTNLRLQQRQYINDNDINNDDNTNNNKHCNNNNHNDNNINDTKSSTYLQEIFIGVTKLLLGLLMVTSFGYFTILSSRQKNYISIKGSDHQLNENFGVCNQGDILETNNNDEIDSCFRKTAEVNNNLKVNDTLNINKIKHMSVSSLYSCLSYYFNFAFRFMHCYLHYVLMFASSRITKRWDSNTNDNHEYKYEKLRCIDEP